MVDTKKEGVLETTRKKKGVKRVKEDIFYNRSIILHMERRNYSRFETPNLSFESFVLLESMVVFSLEHGALECSFILDFYCDHHMGIL